MARKTLFSAVAVLAILAGSCQTGNDENTASEIAQAHLETRQKPVIQAQNLMFRDLNDSGTLDPYEDWRLSPEARARDLVSRMTIAEKAGMMLIASQNPECDGTISRRGRDLMESQHMTRFILRATAARERPDCSVRLEGWKLRGGYPMPPADLAAFLNEVQAIRESTRLGIPALFKDNPRNHVENQPLFGIGQGAGAMSEFPKPAGLAAAALGAGSPPTPDGAMPETLKGDMSIIEDFAGVMGAEWAAMGLRGMYGYTIDLATEPRWSRVHETFSENADLTSDIVSTLIGTIQGSVQGDGLALSDETEVSFTMKHFPGGGPQLHGLDPHYTFGKMQVYSATGRGYGFDYHLKPFEAAINAGVGAIMPYYGVPKGLELDGTDVSEIGMAFSPQIIDDLLRQKLGFRGYVNSDSGIVGERSWGLESFRINPETGEAYTIPDRIAASVHVGTDVFSEFSSIDPILALAEAGQLSESDDINPAVERLLVEQFALGLFEDPYVDADAVTDIVGSPENRAKGLDIQRRSMVLLQNGNAADAPVLPVSQGASVYVMGFKADDLRARGFGVTDGNYDAKSGETRPVVPAGTDRVILNVKIKTGGTFRYRSDDPATGGRAVDPSFGLVNAATGALQESWGAQDPCVYEKAVRPETEPPSCLDNMLIFGGPFPWEVNTLSLSSMTGSESWSIEPSLADIQAVMVEVDDPARVILSIEFRNPYVLDQESGVLKAGAIIGTFGVSDQAQLDVLTGTANVPMGRLPFALPATERAVLEQASDAPGYAETQDGELFPYGFGLGYAGD